MKLVYEELKRQLYYDTNTGLFIRLIKSANCVKIGDIAGNDRPDGYREISINNKKYLSHRLAWFYMKGYLPEHDIHHKDENRSNNKWG